MSEVSSAPYSALLANWIWKILFCSNPSCLILIKNLLTSYWQIVLLPQRYYFFCKPRVRAENAILVIPYNNLVRIEDTALKWSFIMHMGCINEIKVRIGFLDV